MDRQYALLVDSRLNTGLPETLVPYEGCGLKGLQLTCSALAARAVQRSAPDTVLSRPTEVNNRKALSKLDRGTQDGVGVLSETRRRSAMKNYCRTMENGSLKRFDQSPKC